MLLLLINILISLWYKAFSTFTNFFYLLFFKSNSIKNRAILLNPFVCTLPEYNPGSVQQYNVDVISTMLLQFQGIAIILLVLILLLRLIYNFTGFKELAFYCICIDLVVIFGIQFLLQPNMLHICTDVFTKKLNNLAIYHSVVDSPLNLEFAAVDYFFGCAVVFFMPLIIFLLILGLGSVLFEVRYSFSYFSLFFFCYLLIAWMVGKGLPYSINVAQMIGQSIGDGGWTVFLIQCQQRLLRSSILLFFILIHSVALVELTANLNTPRLNTFLNNMRNGVGSHTALRRVLVLVFIVYLLFIWGKES